mgnify:FL=1
MALATLIAYLVAGTLFATLLQARTGAARVDRAGVGAFLLQMALWPLFVPLMVPAATRSAAGAREWDARIERAEKGLDAAIQALGRELDDPLAIENARVRSLGTAMRQAAARLVEIECALTVPGHDERELEAQLERQRESQNGAEVAGIIEQRLAHFRRLRALRDQARADLERALARADELATRLTLVRYEDSGRLGMTSRSAREATEAIEELCRTLGEVRAA